MSRGGERLGALAEVGERDPLVRQVPLRAAEDGEELRRDRVPVLQPAVTERGGSRSASGGGPRPARRASSSRSCRAGRRRTRRVAARPRRSVPRRGSPRAAASASCRSLIRGIGSLSVRPTVRVAGSWSRRLRGGRRLPTGASTVAGLVERGTPTRADRCAGSRGRAHRRGVRVAPLRHVVDRRAGSRLARSRSAVRVIAATVVRVGRQSEVADVRHGDASRLCAGDVARAAADEQASRIADCRRRMRPDRVEQHDALDGNALRGQRRAASRPRPRPPTSYPTSTNTASGSSLADARDLAGDPARRGSSARCRPSRTPVGRVAREARRAPTSLDGVRPLTMKT